MRQIVLYGLATLTAASSAAAQAINIDVGDPTFPVPSNTYGAGAAQPGTWNAFGDPANVWPLTLPVVDLTGAASGVTVTGTNPGPNQLGNFEFDNQNTFGDDGALLDDLMDVGGAGATSTWTFSGLSDGAYDVYTYAFSPDTATFQSEVLVTGSSDPAQIVVGDFPGMHVLGMTYALHTVSVSGGSDIEVIVNSPSGIGVNFGSVNGFQVKPSDAPQVGTNYCQSSQNSTGNMALMSASGSTSVGANDLVLHAGIVPDQPGLFYYGPNQVQVPFGNGFRCIDGGVGRLDIINPTGGMYTFQLDNTNPPNGFTVITPSSTWNFQCWYRDPADGGALFNLSDGLEVQFGP